MFLLADIGGTHARFALAEGDVIRSPVKYCAENFGTLEEAMAHFCDEEGCKENPELLIATAARQGKGGAYRFTNNNRWIIEASALEQQGWKTDLIVNDFVASARGALALSSEQTQKLRDGVTDPETPSCILGPGTGLGLAYMHGVNGRWVIQETAGAHMQATAVTDEQRTIMKLVARLKDNDSLLSPEDLASGRGLPVLYQAVCLYNGQDCELSTAAALLESPEGPCAQQALRLFHEFLGLFAHNAIVTAHAYGGLYLDGGVLHHLREKGLFDFKTFEKFMTLEPIAVVKEALDNMPITVVTDPFVALQGVWELYKDDR